MEVKKSELVKMKGDQIRQLVDEVLKLADEIKAIHPPALCFVPEEIQSAAQKINTAVRHALLTMESLEYVLTDEERDRLSQGPAGLLDPRYRGD